MFDKNIVKNLIKTVIVFIIFWFSSYLVLIPFYIFKINPKTMSSKLSIILSSIISFIVLIIFTIIYYKDLKEDLKKFKNNIVEYMDTGVKYWLIGIFLMAISNLILTFILKAGGAQNQKIVDSMIKTIPWLMLIEAGIVAPFNEEIVFRKSLKDVFKNKWIFILISFLLFGGAHVIASSKNILDFLYIIPYGFLGGAFALAYYDTDNIFTSISLHMMHNTILILIMIITSYIK